MNSVALAAVAAFLAATAQFALYGVDVRSKNVDRSHWLYRLAVRLGWIALLFILAAGVDNQFPPDGAWQMDGFEMLLGISFMAYLMMRIAFDNSRPAKPPLWVLVTLVQLIGMMLFVVATSDVVVMFLFKFFDI